MEGSERARKQAQGALPRLESNILLTFRLYMGFYWNNVQIVPWITQSGRIQPPCGTRNHMVAPRPSLGPTCLSLCSGTQPAWSLSGNRWPELPTAPAFSMHLSYLLHWLFSPPDCPFQTLRTPSLLHSSHLGVQPPRNQHWWELRICKSSPPRAPWGAELALELTLLLLSSYQVPDTGISALYILPII